MIVMAFDLSSSCIGCVVAEVNGKHVQRIKSCPIIPEEFTAEKLGFLKRKQKVGETKSISSWVYYKGENVSQAEKKRRDVQVRSSKDTWVLSKISQSMGDLIDGIRPDLIIVEKNEIFNGMLTSVLLGKVMGTLHGIAGLMRIPIQEYRVNMVRKPLNIGRLVQEFVRDTSADELRATPDITKRALRRLMERTYNIHFMTDDESDACVVFNYWLNHEREPG